jgi:hypothetical protein
MTRTHDRISMGYIPFVLCGHSGTPEWTPAHYRIGKVTHLISCVVCLTTYGDDDVEWLTATEASERHGWSVVSSVGTSPVS